MKKKPKVFITEKVCLDNGAYFHKKITKIEINCEEVPFRQLNEHGAFEIL